MVKNQSDNSIKKNLGIILIFIVAAIFTTSYYFNHEVGKNLISNILIDETDMTQDKTERMLQLEELQKQNSEIVAYIEIDGTDVNYPIMQGQDNDFYMNHDYKKEYNPNGSLFLDKDYDWNLPSANLLIYGHNNKNGTMFSSLLKYKEENFYREHKTIRFTTATDDSQFEILSAFLGKVYKKTDQDAFRYYYFVNANSEEDYNQYISNCKKNSLYDTNVTAEYGDQLLTLSTCSYHTKDGRFVVVAKKIE